MPNLGCQSNNKNPKVSIFEALCQFHIIMPVSEAYYAIYERLNKFIVFNMILRENHDLL